MGTDPVSEAQDIDYEVVIVGAGFAGLYALHEMRRLGFSAHVYEAGDGVGGTWYWNRYPGARCDVESMDYSYSFSEELQQDWTWSERYAAQPEILAYLNFVADRFDLRRDIQLETRVVAATFDDASNTWLVTTDGGESVRTRFCVMAAGCLSAARMPDFPGLSSFEGEWYRTSMWPRHPVEFRGKRVGIVGTGSSGVQAIPVVAQTADHLYVFQRTANYSVPARNRPVTAQEAVDWKLDYRDHRRLARTTPSAMLRFPNPRSATQVSPEERDAEFEARWEGGGPGFIAAFADLLDNREANELAADFVRRKISRIVEDPEVAKELMPTTHPLGTKRLCADTNYYQTYNRDNVTLVNVQKNPIVEILPKGLRTTETDYELDMIVYAIGFDAMTGALLRIDVTGAGGTKLADHWAAGARTYMGLGIAGFPNMLLVASVGSPAVLANMPTAIEQHIDWISDLLTSMRDKGRVRVEATSEAEEEWVQRVNREAAKTLYPTANSWYVGANIEGKPRVFLPFVGGFARYAKLCDNVAARDYAGFMFA
ncbi:MAG: cyclohexanone monooxygenase [Subtercola sp.]|nr:cyclohexanone monooxygenase [Subtercola sp.]